MFIEIKASKQSLGQRKKIYGIGINDSEYNVRVFINGKTSERCPYYSAWTSMLNRCYSDKFHKRQESYKDCIVCDEWLTFTNFKKWMKTKNWKGKAIDKDIIKQGNKIYCPDYCEFVPKEINQIVTDGGNKNELPNGVCHNKRDGNYKAQISKRGKHIHLGYFDNIKEANMAYRKAKKEHITEVAIENYILNLIPLNIFDSLINWNVK
jgi:hypothetical protein